MKITKVDRTRSAVGKRETAPGAGRGILYRSPSDGEPLTSVESQVEARVNAANRMYSAFFKGRKTDPATRNLQRYFTEIVKYLAKEDSIRATYAGGEEQAIRAAIEGQIGKLKCMKWIFVYNAKKRESDRLEIAKLPRMYNSEDAFRDAMRESFLCMRRSLKRGTNRRVAEKLMRGLAKCGPLTFEQAVNELDRDSHEELVHFLDCVNRDYHRTNVAKSIQNNDVKVQAGQEQLLELTCATDEKNSGLRKTIEDYASSQEQGEAALLTIKKILFSYFLSGDEKAAEEFLQTGKLWNIPRQEELFFDESFEGEGQDLRSLFEAGDPKDAAVKKRINYVNYGTYLNRKKEADTPMEQYWLGYIKEYVEQHYVAVKRPLKRRECFATEMLHACWKEIIRFLCGKYIDIGKAVYHFAMPDELSVPLKGAQAPSYGQIRKEYSGGISSFAYESIKAQETIQRDISVAAVAAAAAFSRSVLDANRQKDDAEDIFFLSDDELCAMQKANAKKQLLRFYGGASTLPEMADVDAAELVTELRSHLKAVRNANFHYGLGRKDAVSLNGTKVLYACEKRAYADLIRQRYYSNNVGMFYTERALAPLVERLYEKDRMTEAQIPSFQSIFKRKELPEYIRENVKLPRNMTDGERVVYEGTLYFLLKEIYYRDFLTSGEAAGFFFNAVRDHRTEMERHDRNLKNAAINFANYVKELEDRYKEGKLSFGEVCQYISQEYNRQNTGKEETAIYKHFKILFPRCLKRAFCAYVKKEKNGYAFLQTPQRTEISGEAHYLDQVEIGCSKREDLTEQTAVWYTFAHFLHPRQLNHLVGDFKSYIQFQEDIFRRKGYAGQLDSTDEPREKEKQNASVKRAAEVLKVLDFVRGMAGRVSSSFEDYYESKEEYAQNLGQYIRFGADDAGSAYNSLTSFCLHTLEDGRPIDIYADEKNPKLLRNVEIARMYAGGDIPLRGYRPVQAEEIRKFYRTKDEAEKILSKGLCSSRQEQEKVARMQQLKNRMTLNEVTDIFALVNDLLGRLISLAYLRERDEMYLLLGFYYMAQQKENGWGETLDALSTDRYEVAGGLVLYQICGIFDFGIPLLAESGEKWKQVGGQTSTKLMAFYRSHKASLTQALRLFMDDTHDAEVIGLRNYVEHSKYYANPDRSLIGLYSDFYTKFFGYSTKLRKSVAFNFTNALEACALEGKLSFDGNKSPAEMKLNAVKSSMFTYKLQGGKTVELPAKPDTFVEGVKGILNYHS